MMRRMAVLGACVGLLAGCGFPSLTSLPLPGGAATGKTYTVTVVFADAATLLVRDGVRVNDVPVGEISSIGLTADLKAKVVCKIKSSVHLPRNAVATIASTSLLGEDFVALAAPLTTAPSGVLANGDTVTGGTTTDPDVEQVLGALSSVLNGGSIGQLQIVVRELNNALHGRTGDVASLLARLKDLVGSLDAHKQTIVAALDGMDRLSAILASQHAKLGAVLDQLPSGINILAQERPKLTALVVAVGKLGQVATHVINASRDNLVADLAYLKPVLSELSKRGTEIATSLNYALTFPFGKDALAAFKGDYAGFYATINLNADDLSTLLGMVSGAAVPTATTAKPAASATTPVRPVSLTPVLTNLGQLLVGVLNP